MKYKITFLVALLALFIPSLAKANQSATMQYCKPLNQINDGDTLDAVPVMANYNGDESCLENYGDLFTDGPFYSPTLTTSTSSLSLTLPANVWSVKGRRVYSVSTAENASASLVNYYWLDIYGVWRATTNNTAPTVYSDLEYTATTNTSGIISSTAPTIAIPSFFGGVVTNALTSPAGMLFKIQTAGSSFQFQNHSGTVVGQINDDHSGEMGAGIVSWDNLGNVSLPNLLLGSPLGLAQGGTGTATPGMTAGSGIVLTGTFPNYTISATGQSNPVVLSGNNVFTGSNSFTATTSFSAVSASGPLYTTSSVSPPVLLSSTNVTEVSWNGSGNNEATLTNGYNGSVTAAFMHNGGSSIVLSSKILSDGTYVPGSSGTTYGPSNANLTGTLSVAGQILAGTSGGTSGANEIAINPASFSPNIPVIVNDSYGGMNIGIASSDTTYGFRIFSVSAGPTLSSLLQITPAGVLNMGNNFGGSFQYNFNPPTSAVNGMIVGVSGANFTDTDPGINKALSVMGNVSITGYYKAGSSSMSSASIVSAGNIYTNNGILAAPANVSTLNLCPANNCNSFSTNSTSTTILGTGQSTQSALTIPNGDIEVARNGNTGVIFFGNEGTNYLYFDGANYNMPQGNLIVGGTVTANSSRSAKFNIKPIMDPIKLASETNFVQYCYKYEKCNGTQERHLGFIAEDTPIALSVDHKHYDIGATAAAALAGVKELEQENQELRKQIASIHGGVVPHQVGLGERIHDFIFGT
jgi:hypothetical protein